MIHVSQIEALSREGLVHNDLITFYEVVGARERLLAVNVRGRLECAHRVVLRIDTWLEVRRGRRNVVEVRTRSQSYHAWQRAAGDSRPRDLLRYDDSHEGRLHRHFFDSSGDETDCQPIRREEMPRLDAVIREALLLATSR